jgi:hypothetical protein
LYYRVETTNIENSFPISGTSAHLEPCEAQ